MKKIMAGMVLLCVAASPAFSQMVSSVAVHFKTKSDARATCAPVEILYKTSDDILVASKTDATGMTPNTSYEVKLDLLNTGIAAKSFVGSKIVITYYFQCNNAPKDTWSFDCDLYVTYSDGSIRVFPFRTISLSKTKTVYEKAVSY